MLLKKSILFITNCKEDNFGNTPSESGVEISVLPYNAVSICEDIKRIAPDSVLLDAFSVEDDLFEVIRMIKDCSETKDISVGVVSSVRSEKLKRIILSGGASFYLSKPIDQKIFSEIIITKEENLNSDNIKFPPENNCLSQGFSYFKQSITLKGHG